MDVTQAVSRALLGAGLLLVAPGLAACDGDPATGNQEAGDNNSSVQGPATSGDAGSGVGRDDGGGSPIMEATGRAEDTGDRAGHGSEEGSEEGSGEESGQSSEGTGE